MTRIKVAVRVRPLSNREVETGSTSIIAVEGGKTVSITNTKVPEQNAGDSRERVRRFTFDYCFQEDSTQDHIFEEIDKVIGQSIKRRFHSCVLAYGQSSTGKTHTMMGFPHDPGLTPKLCHRVFGYLQETAVGDELFDLKVSVSYLEIYNEKVRDLLRKDDVECFEKNSKNRLPLKIREHPKKGPYVQGLSEHSVTDSAGLLEWLELGNRQRRVAATVTNPRSSRSHSVFSISCDGVKLHLIDLAGSERAGSRCYGTSQFREGANINKSLVALGNVISALAEQTAKQAKGLRRKFVPYRDSVLTWLLKDTLGGNSNTVMVATVSPSSACYSETVNTLRFGQRAKLIVSHPVVNEDPKEKTIRELRAEIARLRDLLNISQFSPQAVSMLKGDSAQRNGKLKEIPPTNTVNADTEVGNEIREDKPVISEINAENDENSGSEQLSTSVSNQSLPNDNDLTLIDGETESTDTISNSETTTEKLLPLLSVTTSVRPTKLRRTFSVDHTYTDHHKPKMFGSEESIPSSSSASKKSHSSSTLEKQKSQESISRRTPGSAASAALLRRRSLNKSNPLLPKTPPKRRSLETNLQRNEKSVNTDNSKPKKVESKVNSIRKQPIKPRSHIVAAVTSRLYAKTHKKEVATNTEELNTQKGQTPKESAPSNARSRLAEISRRALKAHRQKNEQTQTELVSVVRCKEISTDVDDLKLSLHEVRDAQTEISAVETKEASVNCTILNQLGDDEKLHNISFTRSCGTQSTSQEPADNATGKVNVSSTKPVSNPISFTKYLRELQDPTYEVADVMPNTPIYTKTVNINISHNYINRSASSGSISDDSIERNSQNVSLPTPDLISNHNSLEPSHDNLESSQVKNQEKIYYAKIGELDDYFTEDVLPAKESQRYQISSYTVLPKCNEKVQSIKVENVQAPQICLTHNFEGVCEPLPTFEPVMAKPKIVESKCYKCDDCITLEEPLVLKSIVKQLPKNNVLNDINSTSDDEILSSDIPDSLDYHMMNTKKVKFNRKNAKQPSESGRILNAMSEFLEEATNLMSNLTMAASKMGSNNLQLNDSYEFEVTVNGVKGIGKPQRKRRRASRSVPRTKEPLGTQRCSVNRADCSTQCETTYSLPINKYEALVEESCRRLEEKVNKMPTHQQNIHYREYDEEIVDPYFSHHNWERGQHLVANDVEDSSLESNPVTYSDYGSLPRKTHKRQRTPTCSPSAFLRQLTNMRKQIIESSREEFLNMSNH